MNNKDYQEENMVGYAHRDMMYTYLTEVADVKLSKELEE